MPQTDCGPFRDALDATPSPETAEHASTCAECAKILARQRNLERLLSQWPETPPVDLRPPELPAHAGGRLLPMRAPAWLAAAAAAVLVAVAWTAADHGVQHVRVERVVDVADGPPQVDERLLALTGGVEAVAMRRPTELR
jgi:hypothetical protein